MLVQLKELFGFAYLANLNFRLLEKNAKGKRVRERKFLKAVRMWLTTIQTVKGVDPSARSAGTLFRLG